MSTSSRCQVHYVDYRNQVPPRSLHTNCYLVVKFHRDSLNGYKVLSHCVDFIDQIMAKGLEEWSTKKEPIELFGEIGSLFFKVISIIFCPWDRWVALA